MEENPWERDYVKTLEPKPGRAYNNDDIETVEYLVSEVSIEFIDNAYNVKVNESASSRLNISNFYKDLVGKDLDQATEEFITNKIKSDIWIINSIEQRRVTIKKVVGSILKHQNDFS